MPATTDDPATLKFTGLLEEKFPGSPAVNDWKDFRLLFSENRAQSSIGVPVIDHWWQTETGWAICANCAGIHEFPVKEGSPTKAVPGWDVQVVDNDNKEEKLPYNKNGQA